MDKYIKADDLLEAIYPVDPENDGSDGCTVVAQPLTLTSEELETMIDALPAADVAPVVHGKWVMHRPVHNPYMGSGVNYRCSVCDRPAGYKQVTRYSFCPRCGAKMDLEG